MRLTVTIAALTIAMAVPAAAQSVLDMAGGLYGDATDPAMSCATNPHRLDLLASPPHVVLTWSHPAADETGRLRRNERYDVLGAADGTLTLRLEGETRRTGDGSAPIWIMRLKADGYCWGRADWPVIRCERPQFRCDGPVS